MLEEGHGGALLMFHFENISLLLVTIYYFVDILLIHFFLIEIEDR